MRCPTCRHPVSGVLDSRPDADFTAIRRRRECRKCGGRFTTYEVIVAARPGPVWGDEARRQAEVQARRLEAAR